MNGRGWLFGGMSLAVLASHIGHQITDNWGDWFWTQAIFWLGYIAACAKEISNWIDGRNDSAGRDTHAEHDDQ